MGRRAISGGVRTKGSNRIQFDFELGGVRYRPTVVRMPSEANLRRARKQLEDIKARIANGTFNFADEFPDFRDLGKVAWATTRRTCNNVFDEFIGHCKSRLAKSDLTFATFESYRKIIDNVWRPKIGADLFETIKYSALVKIVDSRKIKKKTYNNIVSAVRCAFDYGYRDHPEIHNPASGLRCFRISKKDRPVVDPFTIQEAETLIAAIHKDWGEAQGNYDEFRFFTGLRPSEQIALLVSDCDVGQAKISVTKARVMTRDKDRTKTGEDRLVELNQRALQVLKRQLALHTKFKLAGKINHSELFFKENGEPIRSLQYPWRNWKHTLQVTLKGRYREPYNARHSSVSWNLMIGKNLLWVSKQHGHSVQTMLDVYATWIEGAKESDIEAIKRAMESRPRTVTPSTKSTLILPLESPEFGTDSALGTPHRRVSYGKIKPFTGGERGTRTLDLGIMSATL
jgi:integrase